MHESYNQLNKKTSNYKIYIESCNWIDFISVAYASWYHWSCGKKKLIPEGEWQ